MARIYVASSWRNQQHAHVVKVLSDIGHEVYNFKNIVPSVSVPMSTAFSWAEIDAGWQQWTPKSYRNHILNSQRVSHGYLADFRGMEWADVCVLLMPCGRSAHLEAGYMKGRGKKVYVYFPEDVGGSENGFEPDLMYLMANAIVIGQPELLNLLCTP